MRGAGSGLDTASNPLLLTEDVVAEAREGEGERSGELPSSLRRHFESMVAPFIDSPRAAASAIAGSSGIARCGASSSALLNLTDSPQRGLAYRGRALLGCFL